MILSRLAVTSQDYKPSKGNVGSFETRGVNSEFDSRVSVRPSNRPSLPTLFPTPIRKGKRRKRERESESESELENTN